MCGKTITSRGLCYNWLMKRMSWCVILMRAWGLPSGVARGKILGSYHLNEVWSEYTEICGLTRDASRIFHMFCTLYINMQYGILLVGGIGGCEELLCMQGILFTISTIPSGPTGGAENHMGFFDRNRILNCGKWGAVIQNLPNLPAYEPTKKHLTRLGVLCRQWWC